MSIKDQIYWALKPGAYERKGGVFYVLLVLPTLSILSLVEDKLGIFSFFKEILLDFRSITHAFWGYIFHLFEVEIQISVYQFDLLTLFFLSAPPAIVQFVRYGLKPRILMEPPPIGGRFLGFALALAPLFAILYFFVFSNISEKLSSPSAIGTMLTSLAIGVLVLLAQVVVSVVRWVFLKKKPNFRAWPISFLMILFLYIFLCAFQPDIIYNKGYGEMVEGQEVPKYMESLLGFYIPFMLASGFLFLYAYSWRNFLWMLAFGASLFISDIGAQVIEPHWLVVREFLESEVFSDRPFYH